VGCSIRPADAAKRRVYLNSATALIEDAAADRFVEFAEAS
jgi:hypothetical protein